jgi:hypothetical protein
MHRSRSTPWLLGLAALVACDRADPPTMPPASLTPLLARDPDPRNRSYFSFRNQTGQTARRLVVQFNGAITTVPYAAAPSVIADGASLTLSSLFNAALALPLDSLLLSATVDAKNIRIDSWYWSDANGSVLGTTNKGCSDKQGCASVPPPFGFKIVSPPVVLPGFQEIGYCYYFRTPNAADLAVQKWRATLGPGAKRVNVVFTDGDAQPPFTQSSSAACAAIVPTGSSVVRHWAFTAYQASTEYTFPGDDGSGKPIGLMIPPGQAAYLYIHYRNPTDNPLTTHVEVEPVPYARGTEVTPARSFVTYNNSLNIPAGEIADSETQTCTVPPGAKFFYVTTYAHQQMVHAYVRDGITTVFESTDPFNPGSRSWTPPFFTFATGKLTHEFVYANPTNRTITSGPSNATDEEAITLSYFFPATAGKICFDGFGPF